MLILLKLRKKKGGCSFGTASSYVGVHFHRSMPWKLTCCSEVLLLVGSLREVWYITWHHIPSSKSSVLKWQCNLYVLVAFHKNIITGICFFLWNITTWERYWCTSNFANVFSMHSTTHIFARFSSATHLSGKSLWSVIGYQVVQSSYWVSRLTVASFIIFCMAQ